MDVRTLELALAALGLDGLDGEELVRELEAMIDLEAVAVPPGDEAAPANGSGAATAAAASHPVEAAGKTRRRKRHRRHHRGGGGGAAAGGATDDAAGAARGRADSTDSSDGGYVAPARSATIAAAAAGIAPAAGDGATGSSTHSVDSTPARQRRPRRRGGGGPTVHAGPASVDAAGGGPALLRWGDGSAAPPLSPSALSQRASPEPIVAAMSLPFFAAIGAGGGGCGGGGGGGGASSRLRGLHVPISIVADAHYEAAPVDHGIARMDAPAVAAAAARRPDTAKELVKRLASRPSAAELLMRHVMKIAPGASGADPSLAAARDAVLWRTTVDHLARRLRDRATLDDLARRGIFIDAATAAAVPLGGAAGGISMSSRSSDSDDGGDAPHTHAGGAGFAEAVRAAVSERAAAGVATAGTAAPTSVDGAGDGGSQPAPLAQLRVVLPSPVILTNGGGIPPSPLAATAAALPQALQTNIGGGGGTTPSFMPSATVPPSPPLSMLLAGGGGGGASGTPQTDGSPASGSSSAPGSADARAAVAGGRPLSTSLMLPALAQAAAGSGGDGGQAAPQLPHGSSGALLSPASSRAAAAASLLQAKLLSRPSLQQLLASNLIPRDVMMWTQIALETTPASVMPQPRNCHTLTLVGRHLYLLGGYAQAECPVTATALDVDASTWDAVDTTSAAGFLPQARYAHTATPCRGGFIVMFGGYGGGGWLNDVWICDTAAGGGTGGAAMASPAASMGAGAVAAAAVTGGAVRSTFSSPLRERPSPSASALAIELPSKRSSGRLLGSAITGDGAWLPGSAGASGTAASLATPAPQSAVRMPPRFLAGKPPSPAASASPLQLPLVLASAPMLSPAPQPRKPSPALARGGMAPTAVAAAADGAMPAAARTSASPLRLRSVSSASVPNGGVAAAGPVATVASASPPHSAVASLLPSHGHGLATAPTRRTCTWFLPPVRGSPPKPRAAHTAVCFHDGASDVLVVFGGNDGSGLYNDTWLCRLGNEELEWVAPTVLGPLPTPRSGHTAVAYGSQMLVFGGGAGWGAETHNDLAILQTGLSATAAASPSTRPGTDAASGSSMVWIRPAFTGTPPPPRTGHAACVVGASMLIFGGGDAKRAHNDLFVFDIASSHWSRPADTGAVPSPRAGHTATAVGSYVVIFGGCTPDGTCYNDLFVLDSRFQFYGHAQAQGPTTRIGDGVAVAGLPIAGSAAREARRSGDDGAAAASPATAASPPLLADAAPASTAGAGAAAEAASPSVALPPRRHQPSGSSSTIASAAGGARSASPVPSVPAPLIPSAPSRKRRGFDLKQHTLEMLAAALAEMPSDFETDDGGWRRRTSGGATAAASGDVSGGYDTYGATTDDDGDSTAGDGRTSAPHHGWRHRAQPSAFPPTAVQVGQLAPLGATALASIRSSGGDGARSDSASEDSAAEADGEASGNEVSGAHAGDRRGSTAAGNDGPSAAQVATPIRDAGRSRSRLPAWPPVASAPVAAGSNAHTPVRGGSSPARVTPSHTALAAATGAVTTPVRAATSAGDQRRMNRIAATIDAFNRAAATAAAARAAAVAPPTRHASGGVSSRRSLAAAASPSPEASIADAAGGSVAASATTADGDAMVHGAAAGTASSAVVEGHADTPRSPHHRGREGPRRASRAAAASDLAATGGTDGGVNAALAALAALQFIPPSAAATAHDGSQPAPQQPSIDTAAAVSFLRSLIVVQQRDDEARFRAVQASLDEWRRTRASQTASLLRIIDRLWGGGGGS